ncbi:MAG: ATP-binding protein [Victivallales bacterium]|nr:ATP-binding protein [Victivallales bacterium]
MSLKKITVQVTDNALHKYENCNVNEALLQVVWNSIDADAVSINVDIEKINDSQSLDKKNPIKIPSQIVISDDDEGIPYDKLEKYLSQLEDSWKRKSTRKNGRTYQRKEKLE